MGFLWFIVALAVLWGAIYGIDVYRHRHPLSLNEIASLALKRQRNEAIFKHDYSRSPRPANPIEKKAMKSGGEFVPSNLAYDEAPSRIAGLLKYKKHEWIVLAFIDSMRVRKLWWNKGPDGTKVWSFLRHHSLRSVIKSLKPDTIAILHNHPNPNPSVLRMNIPSRQDIRSAGIYDLEFSNHRINLLEFICERGIPHLYYASFDDSVAPLTPIILGIIGENGRGILRNRTLRKELKRVTLAETIHGEQRSLTESRVTELVNLLCKT